MLSMWIFDKKQRRRSFMHMEILVEISLKKYKNLKVGFNLYICWQPSSNFILFLNDMWKVILIIENI